MTGTCRKPGSLTLSAGPVTSPPEQVDGSEAGGRGACAASPGGLVAGPEARLSMNAQIPKSGRASDSVSACSPTRPSSSQRSLSQISTRE